jgi:hypothetical protein
VVQSVRGVSVPQPIRANGVGYANSFGRPTHDHADAPAIQETSRCGTGTPDPPSPLCPGGPSTLTTTARVKRRTVWAALPKNGDLAEFASRVQIAPTHPAYFRDAQAGTVLQTEQDAVAGFQIRGEHSPARRPLQQSVPKAASRSWGPSAAGLVGRYRIRESRSRIGF